MFKVNKYVGFSFVTVWSYGCAILTEVWDEIFFHDSSSEERGLPHNGTHN